MGGIANCNLHCKVMYLETRAHPFLVEAVTLSKVCWCRGLLAVSCPVSPYDNTVGIHKPLLVSVVTTSRSASSLYDLLGYHGSHFLP